MASSVLGGFSFVENTYNLVQETIFFFAVFIKEFGPTTPQELSRCLRLEREQVKHLVDTAHGRDIVEKLVRFLKLFPSLFRIEDTCSLAENSGQASSVIFKNIVASRAAAHIKNGVTSFMDIARDIKISVLPVEDYKIFSCLNETGVFHFTEHGTIDLVEELCINNFNSDAYHVVVDYFLKYFRDCDIPLTYERVVLGTHDFSVHVEDGLLVLCALYCNRCIFSFQEGLVSLRINTDRVSSKISLVGTGKEKKCVGAVVQELYGNELFCWSGTICCLSYKSGFIKVLVDLGIGSSSIFYVFFCKDAFEVLFYIKDLRKLISCNDVVIFDAVYVCDPKPVSMGESHWRAVSVRFKEDCTFYESKSLGSQINTGACGISRSDGSTSFYDPCTCRKSMIVPDSSSVCVTGARSKECENSKSDISSMCDTATRCNKYDNSISRSTSKQLEARYCGQDLREQLCDMLCNVMQIPTTCTVQLGDIKFPSTDHICKIHKLDCETCQVESVSDLENSYKCYDERYEGIELLFSGSKLTVDEVDNSEHSFACMTFESSTPVVPLKNNYQSHDVASESSNDPSFSEIQISGHDNIHLKEELGHFEDECQLLNQSEDDEECEEDLETEISVGDESTDDTGLSSDSVHSFEHNFSCYQVDVNNSKTKEQAGVIIINICSVGTQGVAKNANICCSKPEVDDPKLACICYQAIEHFCLPTSSSLSDCGIDNLQSSKRITLWVNQLTDKNFCFLFAEVTDVCKDFAFLQGHYKGNPVILSCSSEVFQPCSSLDIAFEDLHEGIIMLAFVPYIDEDSEVVLPTLVSPVDVGQKGLKYYENMCPEKYFKKYICSTLKIEPNLEFHYDSFNDFNLSLKKHAQPMPKPLFLALKTLLNRKNAKRQTKIKRDWKHKVKQNHTVPREFNHADFSSELLKTRKKGILLNNNPAADCCVVEKDIQLSTSQIGTSSESSVSPSSYVTCPASASDEEDENFSFDSNIVDIYNQISFKLIADVLPSPPAYYVTEHWDCSSEGLTLASVSSESSNTEKMISFLENEGESFKATGINDFKFTKMDHEGYGSSVLGKIPDSTSSSKGILTGRLHNSSRGKMKFQNQPLKSKSCSKYKASHCGIDLFKAKHRNKPRSGLTRAKVGKMQNNNHLFTVPKLSSHVIKARILTVTSAGMLVRSVSETLPITCSFPLTLEQVNAQNILLRKVKMHFALSRMSGIFPYLLGLEMP